MNPARRRERRVGWMAVAFAITVNLLLFLAMAWANAPAARKASPPALVVREIFAAPPPPEPPTTPVEETPLATDNADPLPSDETPRPADATSSETFDLRLDLPPLALDLPAPRVPAPRLDAPRGDALGPVAAERADVAPRRTSTPLPAYPAWARARRMEAVVTLKLLVDVRGRVERVEVEHVEGDPRFGDVARDGVTGWIYEPAKIDGREVPVWLRQRVRFELVD